MLATTPNVQGEYSLTTHGLHCQHPHVQQHAAGEGRKKRHSRHGIWHATDGGVTLLTSHEHDPSTAVPPIIHPG